MSHRLASPSASYQCYFICRSCRQNLQKAHVLRLHTQPAERHELADPAVENINNHARKSSSPAESNFRRTNSAVNVALPPQSSDTNKRQSNARGNHVHSPNTDARPLPSRTTESELHESQRTIDYQRRSRRARNRRRLGPKSLPSSILDSGEQELNGAARDVRSDDTHSRDRSGRVFPSAVSLLDRMIYQSPSPSSLLTKIKKVESRPRTLADKLIEAQHRKPWGDRGTTDGGFQPESASYDSLRKADKISPVPRIPTANNTRAFGFDPNPNSILLAEPQRRLSAAPPGDLDGRLKVHSNVTNETSKQEDASPSSRRVETSELDQSSKVSPPVTSRMSQFFRTVLKGEDTSDVREAARSTYQHRIESSTRQHAREVARETFINDNTSSNGAVEAVQRPVQDTPTKTASRSSQMKTQVHVQNERTATNIGADVHNSVSTPSQTEAPSRTSTSQEHVPSGDANSAGEISQAQPSATKKSKKDMSNREKRAYNRQRAEEKAARRKHVKASKAAKKKSTSKAGETTSTGLQTTEKSMATRSQVGEGQDLVKDDTTTMSLKEAMTASKAAQTSGTRATRKSRLRSVKNVAAAADVEETDHTFPSILTASELHVTPLDVPQPPVSSLAHGLDRVLFNPGVYHLQDPSSRVFNFDPYLEKIMPVGDFNFDSLREYKTSSRDEALLNIADKYQKKYTGSTSSMTSTLSQFHFLLSNWRPINLQMFSSGFIGKETSREFSKITQAPAAVFLRYKDGKYAVDADKEFDNANVLMLLGKSMELLLTLPIADYERYRKTHPLQITKSEKETSETYQYSVTGDFLMRSQLDAHDPRLPGTGVFDLKTRAVVSVRMQSRDYEPMTGYEIQSLQGKWTSYEREYYDMLRATTLKYMLQARIGFMNGIFIAYHNVERIFGFQFVPISDMDLALHSQTDPCLGDQEYRISMNLLNQVLERATARFPNTSLRVHTKTTEPGKGRNVQLRMYVEPMPEEEIEKIQNSQKEVVAKYERKLMRLDVENAGKRVSEGDLPASSSLETNLDKDTMKAQTATVSAVSSDTVVANEEQSSSDDAANAASPSQSKEFESSTSPSELEKDGKIGRDFDVKPLYAATITIRNRVNGNRCENGRPKNLAPHDRWEVEYDIQDHDASPSLWASYEVLKTERKNLLADAPEEGDLLLEDKSADDKKFDSYLKFLRTLAQQGRKYRSHIDEMDKGRAVVALGQPRPPASLLYKSASVKAQDKVIDNIEDYMGWLYEQNRA